MTMYDKRNVLAQLATRDSVILELAAAIASECSDSIGIDILDYPAVDIVGDLLTVLDAFPSGSVDLVDIAPCL
ncbi:MAG: hypothetical protein R2932_26130 [Caldilineaceae bacterium]